MMVAWCFARESKELRDVDMMIDVVLNQIHDFLRPRLQCINQHFAELGLKLCHVPKLLEEEELVLINEGNLFMKTLPTDGACDCA